MTPDDIARGLSPAQRVTHDLKTWPAYWDAVQSGAKNFEVRRDDRGFQRGDIVRLHRYDPAYGAGYSSKHLYPPIEREIAYVLTGGQFGIEPGYVVLGLAVREALKGME